MDGEQRAATADPAADRGTPGARRFAPRGGHPFDGVAWTFRDVELVNWRDGSPGFTQRGVEFPAFWADNAVGIVAGKYFRGEPGTDGREDSLRQPIHRMVSAYTRAGVEHGYFAAGADADAFDADLTWLLLHQAFSFNSPVWFNVGTPSAQQVSACFLLSVEDTMESILRWYAEEGLIFKGGSGAGVNLSAIRSRRERLSSGGEASGPVSFMRGADASAGTIKSGGATRRAAKLVCLDVDHPDIREFIWCKVREEHKIRVLADAGFDMDLGGADAFTAQYQNANNSVRVSDAFMRAAETGGTWDLRARTTGEVLETVDARELFGDVARAAWECADPGMQFDDTVNSWHANPNAGRITTTNPCGEYNSLDNSSCNLASLNLMKFLRGRREFDHEAFAAAVELAVTAMDVSICFADFPSPEIARVTRAYRQLGLGYANLGALLMACGWAYDSTQGRNLAAAVTSLMTAAAYRRSAQLAAALGAYDGHAPDADAHMAVVRRHHDAHERAADYAGPTGAVWAAADDEWMHALELGERHGWRNAQVTLLAPTGTIGLAMGCDTTGVEPAYALKQVKKVADGSSMELVISTVPAALEALGYDEQARAEIAEFVAAHGHVVGAPRLAEAHHPVFACAVGPGAISPTGHVRMMAAVQPFLSGAISKTVNMPASATVADVEQIYLEAWRAGLKAVAVYRDGCKVGQPLSAADTPAGGAGRRPDAAGPHRPARRRLPRSRPARTTKFDVAGAEGYLIAGVYPDGGLGEVFVKMSKQGSTLHGVMDAFSIAVSVALQHGVPLETYVEKFIGMRFPPAGTTGDPQIPMTTSVVDYLFRRLALDHLPPEVLEGLAIAPARRPAPAPAPAPVPSHADAPLCMACGVAMLPAGSCHACPQCGATSGCS